MIEKDKISYETSLCKNYMYKLWQQWSDEGGWCIFIMLNPSTTVEEDLYKSPTVKNCRTIAENLKCGGMVLLDLFPYVAGHWTELRDAKKQGKNIIREEEHDKWVCDVLKIENAIIVAAWGDNPKIRKGNFKDIVGFDDRVKHMKEMIEEHANGKDIKYIEGRYKHEPICHPFWIVRLDKVKGDENIKAKVKSDCKLEYVNEDMWKLFTSQKRQ